MNYSHLIFLLYHHSCPQAEAYERRCDPNGFYMKQLLPHIMNEEKVEDILHRVAGGTVS